MACDKNVKLKSVDYKVMLILKERGLKLLRAGKLTVSQQTIAGWCECCVRTLQSSLDRLRAAGYIAWEWNYRTIGKRNYRCASSYYLLKGNWRNLLAWLQEPTTRKPRKPLQSKVVHATDCRTKTDIYKKRQWTVSDLCGLDRSEGYIAAIMALPDR